jgi:hypothetical protein
MLGTDRPTGANADTHDLRGPRPGTKILHDLRATAATFMVEAGWASTEMLRTNLG